MKKNSTHIILLIDRSGSMSAIQKDMEGGLKQFIEDQKNQSGFCTLTAAQFDVSFDYIYKLKDIKEIEEIKINPRGGTALIDSMVTLIDEAGKDLSLLPEEERPEKVLFICVTDGEENSSTRYKNSELFERIKHQEDKYQWEFVYLGANQDAFTVAGNLGISSSKSMNYSTTTDGIDNMWTTLSSATVRYRSASTLSKTSFNFTPEEQKLNS
jgi:uncharacterized protein YegL